MTTQPPTSSSAASAGAAATRSPLTDRLVLAPVILCGLIPLLLVAVDPWRRPLEVPSLLAGAIMAAGGASMLVRATAETRRAVAARRRTDPDHTGPVLITDGLAAHCRHPRSLAIVATLAGLAMASRSPLLGLHLVATTVALATKLLVHDEPRLAEAEPEAWARYRAAVPRWLPRPTRRR